MFEYEIDRMNHAQLVREAAARRLSREAAASTNRKPRPAHRPPQEPTDDDTGPTHFTRAA
ncbi:hypothetical protein ACFY40_01115 [Streptomyces sp. NPDC012950]|uniref:hypothetical protein n=1 Tax=Streptomyces sp. NPDC012950 TaxID=3364858 RepID=UPI0036C13444